MGKRTKEEQVAEFLREGIIAGRWPRGQKLKQDDVARSLNLSITPVREAFKLLEAEGYLQGHSHRGVVVAPFDLEGAEELLELRQLLEAELVLAALDRLQAEDVEALQQLQAEFRAAVARGDADAVRAINYRFHRRLYLAADRPQTLSFVNILWARYPFDLINRVPGRISLAVGEHAAILDALLRRDRTGLLLALRQHILSGWQDLHGARGAVAV